MTKYLNETKKTQTNIWLYHIKKKTPRINNIFLKIFFYLIKVISHLTFVLLSF